MVRPDRRADDAPRDAAAGRHDEDPHRERSFANCRTGSRSACPTCKVVADVVLSVAGNLPKFERPTEYISLKQTNPPTYTFYHGEIASTDYEGHRGGQRLEDRGQRVRESINRPPSGRSGIAIPTPSGRWPGSTTMPSCCRPTAKAVAKMFGLKKGCCNPYMNSVAQLAEAVHVVEASDPVDR